MSSARLLPVLIALLLGSSACTPVRQSHIEEVSSSQLDLPKNLPFNPLLKSSAPSLRHDAFYKTLIKTSSEDRELTERFITNGKGFVAFSQDVKFDEGGYYLFNFSAHTSLLVNIRDHSFKVALDSPADPIIRAYQRQGEKGEDLGTKNIGTYVCHGTRYKVGEDTIEDWFGEKPEILVEQKITRAGYSLERRLSRYNPDCDTTLLRLPQGFTLVQ